jgi:hypothetical protein
MPTLLIESTVVVSVPTVIASHSVVSDTFDGSFINLCAFHPKQTTEKATNGCAMTSVVVQT